MATLKTLGQLRTLCRERADMENSNFISDSELNSYINSSCAELYDLIVGQHDDYYVTSATLTISSGNTVSLPSDFYKLRGLDYRVDANNYLTVKRFNFASRNLRDRDTSAFYGLAPYREYRVLGSTLR